MRLLPPFFMVRIKSSRDLLPSVSATVSAVSWSKPARRCRSCFIWQFFGLADDGTRNSVQPGLIIHCSLEFASVPVRSRSFFFFKKVDRSRPFQLFLRLVRP